MRFDRIANRIIAMHAGDKEDFDLEVQSMINRLNDLASELEDQDFSDLGAVEKQMKFLRNELVNTSPMLTRQIEGYLEYVSKLLNTIETERRKREDEDRQRIDKSKYLAREITLLANKFMNLGDAE